MNLIEALNVALPELPQKAASDTPPVLDPKVVAREHLEGNENTPTVFAHIPGSGEYFRLTPEQWAVMELFDGQHTYDGISDAYFQKSGIYLGEEWVRNFAAEMRGLGFWYQSPQEKSLAVLRQLAKERRYSAAKRVQFGNLSDVRFPAWDPDSYLTWLERHVRWIYSPWVTALTLCLFGFMMYVFVTGWSEIGSDTLQFYNFTTKGLSDIIEFWLLFFVIVFCHETAHGVTNKHFGGHVHQMGFNLIYLSPCFYVDASELWVYASRWQRVAGIIAGLWTEMIFCSLSTVVWWLTAPGSFTHEMAYKVMLITGIGAVIINLNPLIKLDGYYLLTEIIRLPDLKEESSALVINWVKKNIFGLPVEVPYVRRRRRWLYVPYGVLSSAYSYVLLFAVTRFARNVAYSYNPDWAFIPALLVAYFIFRSRLRTLRRFMKVVYLDKRERLRAWFTKPRIAMVAAALLIFMALPVWRDSVEGRFILEPLQRAIVRTKVPGIVGDTSAQEGAHVNAGDTLLSLSNPELESQASRAVAELRAAGARAVEARMRYQNYAAAEAERRQLAVRTAELENQVSQLALRSPISGVVLTPRVHDLIGAYLAPGVEVAEVADLSTLQARIYVSEYDMRKLHLGGETKLYVDPLAQSFPGRVVSIAEATTPMEEGLTHKQEYRGINPPQYYLATTFLSNPSGNLRDGMTGTARIYADQTFRQRHSIAGLTFRFLRETVDRKVW